MESLDPRHWVRFRTRPNLRTWRAADTRWVELRADIDVSARRALS